MMIDFALAAEREQGDESARRYLRGHLLRFRPIHDDHAGGVARGIAINGEYHVARNYVARWGSRW